MDKRLFAAKDDRDIRDIGADTAVFLWNCFQRELHGVWVSTKQGNLEPHAFGGKFCCQVASKATRDSMLSVYLYCAVCIQCTYYSCWLWYASAKSVLVESALCCIASLPSHLHANTAAKSVTSSCAQRFH